MINQETIAIFRKDGNGDVIALLPNVEVKNAPTGSACAAYSAKSGFFTSDVGVMLSTVAAKPSEYAMLLRQLAVKHNMLPIKIMKRISKKQEFSEYKLVA